MARYGSPGQQIGYRVHPGPEGAPPLLLIHGLIASSASFGPNIEPLTRHFTVITVDLLGHGDSDAPADIEPYRPEAAIERITGLMDHLGYRQTMVCGHSLGGAVALRLALDAPSRVSSLVIINSNSAAGTPEWRDRGRPAMAAMADRLRSEGTGFLRGTRLYPAASRRLPDDARERLTRDFDRLTPDAVIGTALGLNVHVNAFERLPELSVPTLVVIGDRDADFVRNAVAFLDAMPPERTTTVTLEGAGHAANLEQPRQFEAAVVAFARENDYLPPAAPASSGGNGSSSLLTVLGSLLVVAGAGMVAAAFFVDTDDSAPQAPVLAGVDDSSQPTSTPTPLQSSAGARTPGPEYVTATPAATDEPDTPPAAEDTATAAPTATEPTPTEPTAPTSTPVPEDTPTPVDEAQPTPTPEPPTATPAQAGPVAAITGPATAAPGETILFQDASSPEPLRRDWSGCNPDLTTHGCQIPDPVAGCYSVTLTITYATGERLTTTRTVTVGDVTCN